MRENIDVFDFKLTDGEMTRVATLDRGESLFSDHRDPAMVSQLGSRCLD
jgi:2,5-diketo-D-gluconate reductase A